MQSRRVVRHGGEAEQEIASVCWNALVCVLFLLIMRRHAESRALVVIALIVVVLVALSRNRCWSVGRAADGRCGAGVRRVRMSRSRSRVRARVRVRILCTPWRQSTAGPRRWSRLGLQHRAASRIIQVRAGGVEPCARTRKRWLII